MLHYSIGSELLFLLVSKNPVFSQSIVEFW